MNCVFRISAFTGSGSSIAYVASKAAIDNISRRLRVCWARRFA